MDKIWACKVRDRAFLAGQWKLRWRAEEWAGARQKVSIQSLVTSFLKPNVCENEQCEFYRKGMKVWTVKGKEEEWRARKGEK